MPNGFGLIDIVQTLLSNSSVTSTSLEVGTQIDELGKRIASSGIQLAANGQFTFPAVTLSGATVTANSITANVMTANTLTVTGTVATGNTTVTGFVNVSSSLQVAGLSTLTGNTLITSGVLAVGVGIGGGANGDITAARTTNTGAIFLGSDGLGYFFRSNSALIQTPLAFLVSGLTTANAGLVVNGTVTVSGFANVAGNLYCLGLSFLTGNVTLGNFLNVGSSLQVTGISNLAGNVTMSGFANIATSLNVGTTSHMVGAVTHDGLLTQTGNATFAGFINTASTLQVTGVTSLNGPVHIGAGVVVGNTGTWTPIDGSGVGLSLTANGSYTKIGNLVFIQCSITYPTTSNTTQALIGGLPFTAAGLGQPQPLTVGLAVTGGLGQCATAYVLNGSTGMSFGNTTFSGPNEVLDAALSGAELFISGIYTTFA